MDEVDGIYFGRDSVGSGSIGVGRFCRLFLFDLSSCCCFICSNNLFLDRVFRIGRLYSTGTSWFVPVDVLLAPLAPLSPLTVG